MKISLSISYIISLTWNGVLPILDNFSDMSCFKVGLFLDCSTTNVVLVIVFIPSVIDTCSGLFIFAIIL